jgi:hypothetical protein
MPFSADKTIKSLMWMHECGMTFTSLSMESPIVVVVGRDSKSRTPGAQTMRDENTLAKRKRKVGEKYKHIERLLEQSIRPKATHEKLLSLASLLCEEGMVRHYPDRLCRRKKEALICWFCEHQVATSNILERLPNVIQKHLQMSALSSEMNRVAQPISMDIEIDDPFPTDDNDLDTFFI